MTLRIKTRFPISNSWDPRSVLDGLQPLADEGRGFVYGEGAAQLACKQNCLDEAGSSGYLQKSQCGRDDTGRLADLNRSVDCCPGAPQSRA